MLFLGTYSAHFLAHTQDAPAIDTPTKTVVKGEMAELRCHISRITDVELHWRREDGNSLTNNSIDEGGTLIIPNAQETDAGAYICYATNTINGQRVDSAPAHLYVKLPKCMLCFVVRRCFRYS